MKRFVVLLAITAPAIALADRSYNQERNVTHDCSKEGKVSVNVSSTTFVFTGTCDQISLNGASNKITIAATKKVSVTGATNTVDIGAADAISATGVNNTITYKKALTLEAPKVSSPGINNKITQVADTAADRPVEKPAEKPADKPAESKPAPPADKPAGNFVTSRTYNASGVSGTHDCAKEPDVTINASRMLLAFVGECDDINVNGGDMKLAIASTKDIDINGADNTVDLAASDSISINGAGNKVTYKKGIKGAKPRIKNRGFRNSVTQVK